MDYLQYDWSIADIKYAVTVLNLVINGLPSIFIIVEHLFLQIEVLNLVINGLPSI